MGFSIVPPGSVQVKDRSSMPMCETLIKSRRILIRSIQYKPLPSSSLKESGILIAGRRCRLGTMTWKMSSRVLRRSSTRVKEARGRGGSSISVTRLVDPKNRRVRLTVAPDQAACALSRIPNAPTIFVTVSKLGLPFVALSDGERRGAGIIAGRSR
jgi:hypothetical protein